MNPSHPFRCLVALVLLLTLAGFASQARAQTPTPEASVVHAVMFWKVGCHFCEQTISLILPPIQEKYGAQFDLLLIRIITRQDVDDFLSLLASYGIPAREGASLA